MADQKVSNERRRELEQLDPFQEFMIKVVGYCKQYQKQLFLIGIAVIVVIAVFSGIMHSFKKAENTASVMLSRTLTVYEREKDPEKGYAKVEKDFQSIFSDYANTTAGKLARIEFARICYNASKYDLSQQYYEQALELFENRKPLKNFILSALGHVSLAKKDTKTAEKYFSRVESSTTDLLKDEAQFALALISETAGDKEKSRQHYEKIVTEYENSLYYPVAKSKVGQKAVK